MRKVVGIDIRAGQVRAALLVVAARRVSVERLLEVDMASAGTLEQALVSVALPLVQQAEAYAVAVEGVSSFIHRLTLPPTALKQIADVLPFELEAQVPVDLDELIYDYRTLRRAANTDPVVAFVAAARTEYVRERIALLSSVLAA